VRNEPRVPLILALDDASATLEQVGGKGASLARLAAAGLPVPPGFDVTAAAYRRFVTENGLQEGILTAVSAVNADHPATLEAAARQIEGLFAKSVMPSDIAEAIRQAYADLGGGDLSVAVRSSATAEDLPEMSFAGQQETYLNQRGDTMVLEAVKRCWASLWTARAIGYRARHGIEPRDVSLAVVVQKLVPADAAGVLFTANPLTGARDQVVINAAWGLGEAIVGGQVTPDTIVVEKATGAILKQDIAAKDVMTVRTAEGTREEPVPPDRRTRAVLSPAQAAELARIGVRIEAPYGQPMDVEWALEGGHFFVLQARPITALPEPATGSHEAPVAEWTVPNPKGHYMRGSVLELLPDPLSPLFATLGLPAWNRALAALAKRVGLEFPDEVLTTINGYGYYDATLGPIPTAKLLLAMPRILAIELPRLLRTSRSRWQEARSRYAAVVDRWQATDLTTTSAELLLGGAREITSEAAAYYLSVQSGILPAAYISESLFTIVYDRLFRRRGDSTALTFLLGYDSAPMRAEKSLYDLAQWVREQPELATALASMSSGQFTAAYREQAAGTTAAEGAWHEFWRRLSDYLARFGRTIYDLDFAKPVLADDPGALLEALKYFVSGQATDPHKRQASAEAAREQATRTFLARLYGLRSTIFRGLLRFAQTFAPLREDALADVGFGWPELRRMLREVGRRLVGSDAIETPDDVFWLTWGEMRAAATMLDAGRSSARAQLVVAERRAIWEKERTLTPPVALPLKGGARFLGIDLSGVMPAQTGQPEGDVLKGMAASPGQVTGPARVIHGPEEFDQMRPGDILVARITTPAWTPLFALAAGVVTDVGGPLSHSSIVAREYHIPAVLGTGVATERLRSGQRVTLDGDAGTVTVVS